MQYSVLRREAASIDWMALSSWVESVQFPDDENGDGPRNVGLLSIQPRDVASGPRISYLMRQTCVFV